MTRYTINILAGLLFVAAGQLEGAEDRDAKVRNDVKEVSSAGHWIYNDLAKGIEEASKTGKPLLVVFRCIP
jgi:serine protease Do